MAALVIVSYPLLAGVFYGMLAKFAPIKEEPVQLELIVNDICEKAA